MAKPVKEEDDAEKEQAMIIACHHVLDAQVNARQQIDAPDFLNVAFILFRNGVGVGVRTECRRENKTK
ncbi:hypothetical protein SAE02_69150 [Skermanella aerolata]|uniref:Uncharacterized protein n=1 Tax=Skermanella aerolata TaxID=393310 RepID=A0A512E236_9PROT|nr:hypothetical protein SAE02_69150 [Skermanella aerolata]